MSNQLMTNYFVTRAGDSIICDKPWEQSKDFSFLVFELAVGLLSGQLKSPQFIISLFSAETRSRVSPR